MADTVERSHHYLMRLRSSGFMRHLYRMEKMNVIEMVREMKKEDWDAYNDATGYGMWIREVGETVFDILKKKMGEEDNAILFSENGFIFAGLPYDYRAFRGLTAYVARRAAENGLCFVSSPILEYTGNSMEIVVKDHEMALIEAGVKRRIQKTL